jgi:hypothetical protein
MKIHQILDSIPIIITNEERNFINRLGNRVAVTSLDHRDKWLAQNLVRKGVYTISNDKGYIVTHEHETTNTKSLS